MLPPGEEPHGREQIERSLPALGAVSPPRAAPTASPAFGLWRGAHLGKEQFRASAVEALRADPVTRLHLRDEGIESVGVLVGEEQLCVRLGTDELSTMREWDAKEGVSVGTRESRKVMSVCMDLHAARHFTAAASVDGSLK